MLITYKDIAKAAGVSVPSVQRAINGDNVERWPSARNRGERIRSIAHDLGFRKSVAARAMRDGRLGQVGVLLRDNPGVNLLDETLYEIILGINAGLEESGYSMLITRFNEELPEEPRPFRENMLDGLVALGGLPESVCGRAAESVGNIVWVEGPRWEAVNCVRRDEPAAGGLCVEALIAGGRKRIVMVGPSLEAAAAHYSVGERFLGASSAAAAAGIPFEYRDCQPDGALDGLALPDESLGIIAYNHYYAQRILSLANVRGLEVGRGFGLASCDSVDILNAWWPELSHVKIYRFDIGRMAARMAMGLVLSGAASDSVRHAAKWEPGKTA